MGLLFQHETNLVGYHLAVTLQDICHIHKRIRHLARFVDDPRLAGFAKEVLHPLADDGATGIEHEVGHIALVVLYHTDGLVQEWIPRLSCDEHRTRRLHEHTADMAQHMRRHVGRSQFYLTLLRQCLHREIKQRLADGDIDVNRGMSNHQCFVDQPVAIPVELVATTNFGQGNGTAHKSS